MGRDDAAISPEERLIHDGYATMTFTYVPLLSLQRDLYRVLAATGFAICMK